jgi:hypothetical protein
MKNLLKNFLSLQLIFVLTLFPFANLSAQAKGPKVTYKVGADIDSDLKGSDKIFSDVDGTVYLTGGGTDPAVKRAVISNMIEKISPDLKTVVTAYIYMPVPDEDKDQPAFEFGYMGDKLFAFAASTDYDVKMIYAVELDKATLKTIGKPVNVFKCPVSSEFDYPLVIGSVNDEQLMLLKFESHDGGTVIHVKVFDGTLESFWEKNVTAPFGTTSFSLTDLRLLDDGTLFLTGIDKYDEDFAKKAKKEGKPDYMYHIMTFSDHAETVVDRKVDVQDNFIKSMSAEVLPDGRVVACGFYSELADKINDQGFGDRITDGVFYISYDKGKPETSLVKLSKIPAEFITDQEDEGFVHSNKNSDKLKNVYVRQMYARNDGSVTLLGEHIAILPKGSALAVYFLDALVFSIGSNGELKWEKRIFKDQEQRGVYSIDFNMTREYSFYSSVLNDQLLLFFNDDVDSKATINSDETEMYNGEDDCNLICVSIGANGEITKQLVHEFDKTKTSPCVCMFHQTGKSDFIYFGWGHNIADNINSIHITN